MRDEFLHLRNLITLNKQHIQESNCAYTFYIEDYYWEKLIKDDKQTAQFSSLHIKWKYFDDEFGGNSNKSNNLITNVVSGLASKG